MTFSFFLIVVYHIYPKGSSSDIDISRGVSFYDEVKKFEIDLIRRALDQTGEHQSRAARLLGLNATTLNSKIKS